MRRATIASVLCAAMVAGCSFLIQFDDAEPPADAGAEEVPPAAEGGADTGVAFPPPCDPAFPLREVKCTAPRPNCAKSTSVFATYPRDRGQDLVTCNGGASPTCVQHCPFGCVVFPDSFADQCDDCVGRSDGTYCVKDLRGPDARNLGLAVECKGGKTTEVYKCGTAAAACATKCPRAERAPSCCV